MEESKPGDRIHGKRIKLFGLKQKMKFAIACILCPYVGMILALWILPYLGLTHRYDGDLKIDFIEASCNSLLLYLGMRIAS
jgi:hypothetical protein